MSLDLTASKKRGPFVFIGVVALLSLGLAYGLFWVVSSGVMSFGTTNHGSFIEPRTLADSLALVDEDGAAFDTGGVWSLWLVTAGTCDADCRHRLKELQTLHTLLHRDADRVRRYLLAPHLQSLPEGVGRDNPQLKALFGEAVTQLAPGVYIVDPLTQLVLHYQPGVAIGDLLEDLKRLLKVSQIG